MILLIKSLENEKADRIVFNFKDKNPDYIITNYYLDKKYKSFNNDFLNRNYVIFKEIIIDGNTINTVFKKKISNF